MKISEILVEAPDDVTAKMKEYLRKNKGKLTPDQLDAYFGKQGGKMGSSQKATRIAVAKPNTPPPGLGSSQKATRIAVAKPNTPPPGLGSSQKATRIAVAKPTKGDSALDYDDAGYEKYDNPADASTIADLEKADYDSEMAQWNADNKKKSASKKDNSQAILNTEKSNRDQAQKRAQSQKQKELARMKANAGMKDSDYKTSPGSKRTAQDLAKPRANKANAGMKDSDYKTSPGSKRTAQDLALDKEYTHKAPDGRRLKYKHGDIRNAFHSSPDSRKAGSDNVIRGDRVGKRLVDKKPVTRGDDRRDGSNEPRANIASTTNRSGAATNQQAASKFAKARSKAVAKPVRKKAPMPDNWRDGVGDHGK